MDAIRQEISQIKPQGEKNMYAGMQKGKDLMDMYLKENTSNKENRIVFLTDAMPNTGYYDDSSRDKLAKKYADEKIYSTFIGIGVDFDTELIESMTKIRGTNYFSIHSEKQFKKSS